RVLGLLPGWAQLELLVPERRVRTWGRVSVLLGPDDGNRRARRTAQLLGIRGELPDAEAARTQQRHRARRRQLRRPEGASRSRALPERAPRDGVRVLHLERRDVSVPKRRLDEILRERRHAAR